MQGSKILMEHCLGRQDRNGMFSTTKTRSINLKEMPQIRCLIFQAVDLSIAKFVAEV